MDPVSLRERGVNDCVEASSPEAADVFDNVDCCDASSNPAPSGPVVTMLVTGEADEGGCPENNTSLLNENCFNRILNISTCW